MLNKIVFARVRCRPWPYWGTVLGLMVVSLFITVVGRVELEQPVSTVVAGAWGVVSTYMWLCVCAARYRDTGYTGRWAFVTLIPIIGWVEAVALGFRETDDGDGGATEPE